MRPFKKSRAILTLISMAITVIALNYFNVPIPDSLNFNAPLQQESNAAQSLSEQSPEKNPQSTSQRVIILSDQRKQHILYGDKTGGGHKHGIGKPCKSEFPSDWDDTEIIDTVQQIAANDNLPWEKQRNGYHVAEHYKDGTKVRVVLGPQQKHIITAYPTNVRRNPCPANDNR